MTDKKKPEMIQSKPNFAQYNDSFVKNAAGKNDVIKNAAIKTDRTEEVKQTSPKQKLKNEGYRNLSSLKDLELLN